jgi:hypothetical protein
VGGKRERTCGEGECLSMYVRGGRAVEERRDFVIPGEREEPRALVIPSEREEPRALVIPSASEEYRAASEIPRLRSG